MLKGVFFHIIFKPWRDFGVYCLHLDCYSKAASRILGTIVHLEISEPVMNQKMHKVQHFQDFPCLVGAMG